MNNAKEQQDDVRVHDWLAVCDWALATMRERNWTRRQLFEVALVPPDDFTPYMMALGCSGSSESYVKLFVKYHNNIVDALVKLRDDQDWFNQRASFAPEQDVCDVVCDAVDLNIARICARVKNMRQYDLHVGMQHDAPVVTVNNVRVVPVELMLDVDHKQHTDMIVEEVRNVIEVSLKGNCDVNITVTYMTKL